MLVLLGIAEIIVACYSWSYSARIQDYSEATGRVVGYKVGELRGESYLVLQFSFVVDGKAYQGDDLIRVDDKDPHGSAARVLDRLTGPDGLLIHYDPENPSHYARRVPNVWHAKLGIAVGIYTLGVFVWVLLNEAVFDLDENDALNKTNKGLPKFLKRVVAAVPVGGLVVVFFSSPLHTSDLGEVMMQGFNGWCFIAGFAAVVMFTWVIISSNAPLFCRLAGVSKDTVGEQESDAKNSARPSAGSRSRVLTSGQVSCASCGQTFYGEVREDGSCPLCGGATKPQA